MADKLPWRLRKNTESKEEKEPPRGMTRSFCVLHYPLVAQLVGG